MAGRPTLPVGSYGEISTQRFGEGYRARCRFRDVDGVTRRVSATGPTRSAAERNLRIALTSRATGDELTGDSRFATVASLWFEQVSAATQDGERSPSTLRAYRSVLDGHVLPALGQLKLREVSTPRVDRFLLTVRDRSGTGMAKTCRSVVSGVLGYAQRNGAVTYNAARGTTPLSSKPKRQPRAMTAEERAAWYAQLSADATAVAKDLPDLTEFMLSTGVRIGEALALAWDCVDLDAATVTIAYTLIRIKGEGLVRKSTKTAAGVRTLRLPPTTVAMLRRRRRAGRIGTTPVFPDSAGGWRDPYNTQRDIRNARGEQFDWVTSHVFRKTVATVLDDAGVPGRGIANQLGHTRISMTQDVYMGRGVTDPRAAQALDDPTGTGSSGAISGT